MVPPARPSPYGVAPESRCATATLFAALTSGLASVKEPRLGTRALRGGASRAAVRQLRHVSRGRRARRPVARRVVRSAGRSHRRPAVSGGRLRSLASGRRPRPADARRRRAGRRAADRDRARDRTLAVRCAGPRGRRGAAHRIQHGDSRRARSHREGRGHGLHGSDRGRIRHRERARRSPDSRSQSAAKGAVRRRQLRRHRRKPPRSGALRHRGSDGDRRSRAAREVRARARRHAVPRRGVGPVVGRAGQAAPRDSGSLGGAGGRMRRPARRHAHHRRRRIARWQTSSSGAGSAWISSIG